MTFSKCSPCLELMSQQKSSASSHQKDNPRDRLLDDSSDEEPIDPTLKTTEDRTLRNNYPVQQVQRQSAPGRQHVSLKQTHAVERGPPRRRKKSPKSK